MQQNQRNKLCKLATDIASETSPSAAFVTDYHAANLSFFLILHQDSVFAQRTKPTPVENPNYLKLRTKQYAAVIRSWFDRPNTTQPDVIVIDQHRCPELPQLPALVKAPLAELAPAPLVVLSATDLVAHQFITRHSAASPVTLISEPSTYVFPDFR